MSPSSISSVITTVRILQAGKERECVWEIKIHPLAWKRSLIHVRVPSHRNDSLRKQCPQQKKLHKQAATIEKKGRTDRRRIRRKKDTKVIKKKKGGRK